MADSSRPPTSDKERMERIACNAAHGGLMVFRGGVWDGSTLWQDHYDALPAHASKRVGIPAGSGVYQRTDEFCDSRLGYGRARVYQWIPSG